MAEEVLTEPKVDETVPVASTAPTVDELSDNEVATLYNLLFSGINIPARTAVNVVNLQNWAKRLVAERHLEVKN